MYSYGYLSFLNQIIESILVPISGESLIVTNGTIFGLVEQIQSAGMKFVEKIEHKQKSRSE